MIHHIFPSSPRFFRGIFNSISAPRQEGIIQKDLGEKKGLSKLINITQKVIDFFRFKFSRKDHTWVDTDRTFEIATTAARKRNLSLSDRQF